MKTLAWAATGLSLTLASLVSWTLRLASGLLVYAWLAVLLALALLLFPTLWENVTGRSWHIARVLAAACLAAFLFAPIQTHAVKLDLPKPADFRTHR